MFVGKRRNSSQLIGYSGCCKCYRCHNNWSNDEKKLFYGIFKKLANFTTVKKVEILSAQDLARCSYCQNSDER